MRLQKSIKLEGSSKEYTVRELTVKEIMDLLSGSDDGSNHTEEEDEDLKALSGLVSNLLGDTGYVKRFLSIAMPGTKITDLLELAPSELMQIWGVVKEVNSHFFELAQKLEIPERLLGIAQNILTDFSEHAADLSKQAMWEYSNMDIPST